MNVIDAGVVVGLLVGDLTADTLGEEGLAAPHLIDTEVTHVLRRLEQRGALDADQAGTAMSGFLGLELTRFAADGLRIRMWELRHNVTGYDATYVALAESLATSLLTTDARLAAASGITCPIEVL